MANGTFWQHQRIVRSSTTNAVRSLTLVCCLLCTSAVERFIMVHFELSVTEKADNRNKIVEV